MSSGRHAPAAAIIAIERYRPGPNSCDFPKDYRTLFSESPSNTLAPARMRPACALSAGQPSSRLYRWRIEPSPGDP